METHTAIIERLGGIRKVARALSHANHTTVQGWSERNKIPVEHWPALVQLAAKMKKPLTVEDLAPSELKDVAA